MTAAMKKYLTPGRVLAAFAALCVIFALLFALPYSLRAFPGSARDLQKIRAVTASVNGTEETVTLPYTFTDLPARTPVTLSFTVDTELAQSLLIKSVYAPLTVTCNGETVRRYGETGTYPPFFADPPSCVMIQSLPANGGTSHVTVTYEFPETRASLPVAPFSVSNTSGIYRYEFGWLMVCFLLAALIAITGFLLILFSAFVYNMDNARSLLFSLGLFFLSTGLWGVGENDFSVFLIQNPTVLHMFAFAGLFFLPVPLVAFALHTVNFRHPKPLAFLMYVTALAATAAFFLQLAGLVMLSESLFFFHMIHPVSFALLTLSLLYEALIRNNQHAKWMLLPIAELLGFVVLELVNYYGSRFMPFSLPFLIGSFVFLLMMLILTSAVIRQDMQLKDFYEKEAHEKDLMELRLAGEKKRHDMIAKEERRLSVIRHDIRHHVSLMSSLLEAGDVDRVRSYLAELSDVVKAGKPVRYCQNMAVSAVTEHYAALAKDAGIDIGIDIEVPEHAGSLTDTELASVFGNLLENAVEACRRKVIASKVSRGSIRLKSRVIDRKLIIIMDNSLFEQPRKKGTAFLSSKRDGLTAGIGLSSVTAIAKAHDGSADFEADGDVFRSSVILKF